MVSCLYHVLCCGPQPVHLLLPQVPLDRLDRGSAAQVNIAGFPSHGEQQSEFVTISRQCCYLDPRAVWRQTTDDPVSAHLYERIRTTYCSADRSVIEDLSWLVFVGDPIACRNHQCLGLPRNLGAPKFRNSDQAHSSQTSQPGDSPGNAVIN